MDLWAGGSTHVTATANVTGERNAANQARGVGRRLLWMCRCYLLILTVVPVPSTAAAADTKPHTNQHCSVLTPFSSATESVLHCPPP